MRRWLPLLLLACTVTAHAEDAQPKPILILDAGGHTATVHNVLFTPDGKELITVADDRTVRFWDVASGAPLRVLRPPAGGGGLGRLTAAALASDGRTLAVAGEGLPDGKPCIYLIDPAAGRIDRLLRGHGDVIYALAFSPDGKRLASASKDRTARLWDVATGRGEQVLQGHTGSVAAVAFAPDGGRLATASFDGTGRVWSLATGQVETVLGGHAKAVHAVAWSPDGRTLATGTEQAIRLWTPDGKARPGFDCPGNKVTSLAFSGDSRLLLFTCGVPGKAPWVGAVIDLAKGAQTAAFRGHNNTILHGAFSPDGTLAATTGGDDNETYLWRVKDGQLLHRLAGKGRVPWSCAWSADGQGLAWGDTSQFTQFNSRGPLERAFHLSDLEWLAPQAAWTTFRQAATSRGTLALRIPDRKRIEVRQGGQLLAVPAIPEREPVTCATLLGDLVAVGTGRVVSLYDAGTGRLVRELRGHTGLVWAVAASPDERYLLSASDDQTLSVWKPDRDEPLLSLFFAGDDWIAWTPEGYYAASPGGERLMGWQVNDGPDRLAAYYPAARFHKSLFRPDVIGRLLAAGSVERALKLAGTVRGKVAEQTTVAQVLPPRVAITAPTRGQRLARPEVEVRATAQGSGSHPVVALRLLLDGSPYEGQNGVRRIDRPGPGEAAGSWTVRLTPGKHRLAVQADTAASQGLSEEVEVRYVEEAQPAVELPALYVLAVGVAAYPGELKLNYAARDAEAVERLLKEKSKPLYRKVETRLLTDKDATRAGILDGLDWLGKQMTQRDVAVVFFSGHGYRDDKGRFYLLPVDVNLDRLLATGVANDDFRQALEALPGRVLALLDACHSGAVGDGRKGGLTDDLVRDLVRDGYGLIVMCSSMGRESSQESNEYRHGFFTQALVEGLDGKAEKSRDGAVYFHVLDVYVTNRVKELSRGRQHPVTARPTTVDPFPLTLP
jgi:WD40 repeat protein